MRRLKRLLLILLAIIFLFEAWLWGHLEPIVGWIVARIPLRRAQGPARGRVRKLPPAATLVVFIVPVVLLFPLKLLGLWLLAHGLVRRRRSSCWPSWSASASRPSSSR